jgi:hypothetical protein
VVIALDSRGRLDAQPFIVVSIGLRSVEQALAFASQLGENVQRVSPGVYRVGKNDGCLVAAAVGKARARLVCGERSDDLRALLPYATRGLPNESFGTADLHFELRVEPVRRRYGAQIRQLKAMAMPMLLHNFSLDDKEFDRALADTAHAVGDELIALIDDGDRVNLDFSIKRDKELVEGVLLARFRGSSSWTVQTLIEAGKRSASPSETFFRLPKDANSAGWGSTVDGKRFDGIRQSLAALADAWLAHHKIGRGTRDQFSAILLDTYTTSAASVYAEGDVGPSAAAPKGSQLGSESLRELARRGVGWYLLGIEEKSDRYKTYFDKLMRAYNDAKLRRTLEKTFTLKPNDLLPIKSRGTRGLPKATSYEMSLPGRLFDGIGSLGGKPEKGRALPIVLLVVPDGTRTWLGFSADEAFLIEKVKLAMKGDPKVTLASREGLGAMRASRGIYGGFTSVGGFVDNLQASLASAITGGGPVNLTSSMAHRGETPMPFLLTAKSEGSGAEVVWTSTLPKAAIEDLGSLVFAMGAARIAAPPPTAPPPPPTSPVPPAKRLPTPPRP